MQRARTVEEYYLEREKAALADTRIRLSGIPEEFWSFGWDDYDETAMCGDETLKSILVDYCQTWTPADRQSVVMLGKPGFGKTFGMALLAMDLIEQGCWSRWATWAGMVKSKHELFALQKDAERADDWSQHERAEMALRWTEQECDALFLDDVGQEFRSASGWSDTELAHLIRARHSAGKLTFVTSNVEHKDWVRYSEATASFLMQMAEVVALSDGRDHRKRQADKRVLRRAKR